MSYSFPVFSKRSRPRVEGWLAIGAYADRVDLAHVLQRGGQRPEVTLLESYATGGDLVGVLSRLRKDKKLQDYRCSLLLQGGAYQLLQVEAPAVPPDEMRDALRWRVKDMLDYPVETAAIDVLQIPEQEGSGRPRQVLVVTAANEVLSSLAVVFDQAGLNLEAIDIPDMGQRNVATLAEKDGRAVALLTFDATGGLLTVSYQGELFVSRRIDISHQTLEAAEGERRDQLFDRVVLEVQRTLDTFDRQYSFVPMGQLLLAAVPGADALREALAPNVYVPVEFIDLANVLDFPAIPELRHPERQAQCLKLLGAALRV